ncbi:MAG: PLP-dependent aspartate aminotransferase family protein [Flavobacteriaceae bacterium]|nr:PLP-dependent aspartate aminotransferase family protein [Flavobacteriaceae bacterium]
MKFNTKAIHGNQHPEPTTGAVMPPIFQTSTYIQKSPGNHSGYEYSRGANPTRTALEYALASIENGTQGLAFGSGMAATDAVLKMLNPGDEVIAGSDLYGGTYRMFTRIYGKYDIRFHFVKGNAASKFEEKINSKTKLIWLETPTNPLLQIIDIQAVCEIAKAHGILVAVDNTFASPYNQRPLDLGADIVMHSATKYLGGHSDLIAGALITKDEELAENLYFQQFAGGGILGPQDSFLVLRGIKTLAVRMQRHAENAIRISEFLENHPKVNSVFYPGLKSHSGYEIASKQMKTPGGMLSFNLKSGKKEDAFQLLENLNVITLAESLGGVESLANHPATMTHASIPQEVRKENGISDDLIRLSIGIEDVEDILQDLEDALNLI